jgi:hypothetical protein
MTTGASKAGMMRIRLGCHASGCVAMNDANQEKGPDTERGRLLAEAAPLEIDVAPEDQAGSAVSTVS